jgi:hypothetical protein
MIDEAFMPFGRIVERLVSFRSDIVDDDAGARSYIYAYSLDTPVEIDVARDETGALRIGTTPPLYHVETSIRPSFHRLAFTAGLEGHDGE